MRLTTGSSEPPGKMRKFSAPALSGIALSAILAMAGCAADSGSTIQLVQAPCTVPIQDRTPTDIAYRLRYLRVQEEKAIIDKTGYAAPLPVGECMAQIPLDDSGAIDGGVEITCDNPALTADMTKAVAAAAPFAVPDGTARINVGVRADRTEPGVGGQ